MTDSVVTVSGVKKTFFDFWRRPLAEAVGGIDFKIDAGETVALLGPNGSGKSTTVKMLAGLLNPTAGKISIFGENPASMSVKARVGFLTEETLLYPWMTASEILYFMGSLFRIPHAECRERTAQLLELTGLSHAANRKIGTFSKGMLRRIGIAQALVNDPDFLIWDEPTSGLDPIGIDEIRDLIRMLKLRGKTILLTGHLLTDMEAVSDRVLILYAGRICLEGTLDALLTDYEHRTLTFPDLPEEKLLACFDYLKSVGLDLSSVKVGHPRRTLESLFSAVIGKARLESDFQNSGVSETGGMPAYLSPPDQRGLGK